MKYMVCHRYGDHLSRFYLDSPEFWWPVPGKLQGLTGRWIACPDFIPVECSVTSHVDKVILIGLIWTCSSRCCFLWCHFCKRLYKLLFLSDLFITFFHFFFGNSTTVMLLQVYGFETLPVINMELQCWTMRPCRADERHGYPAARRCHSLVQLGNMAYICGGYNGLRIFGDLWMIDLSDLQWTRLPAVLPEPVYFHSAGVTDSGLMVVHGGVVQIDTRRSSKLFAVWLRVPSLKETCWQALIESQPDILDQPRQSLLEVGIPPDLVKRLD